MSIQVPHFAESFFDLPAPPHRSGLPVPNSTHSFWINTPGANPLAKEGSEDDLDTEVDVCIIGTGITGVSAAYHLSKAQEGRESPLKVTILEARDFWRNGGHLTAETFDGFAFRQSKYGPEEAKKAHKLEIHTERALVGLIKKEGWEHIVDLVSNYRVGLMLNDNETREIKADYDAAKKANADLIEEVEWLTEEEVLKVRDSYEGALILTHSDTLDD
ncbi:hypothetical protein H0H93_006318 [Arthromyces matolae]|nr:hypothetical protein H0H93_006318 [Arthromyces matolae]